MTDPERPWHTAKCWQAMRMLCIALELKQRQGLPAVAAMLAMHQWPADRTFWPRVKHGLAVSLAPVRHADLQREGRQQAGTALARQQAAGVSCSNARSAVTKSDLEGGDWLDLGRSRTSREDTWRGGVAADKWEGR